MGRLNIRAISHATVLVVFDVRMRHGSWSQVFALLAGGVHAVRGPVLLRLGVFGHGMEDEVA